MFALTRTCDIQRLFFSQSRYHIFKAHDGSTIQEVNDAVRLSIFLCAFNCEIGTSIVKSVPLEQYFESGTNTTLAALSRTFHSVRCSRDSLGASIRWGYIVNKPGGRRNLLPNRLLGTILHKVVPLTRRHLARLDQPRFDPQNVYADRA